MRAAIIADLGPFNPHHIFLDKMKLRPSDCAVFRKIAGLTLNVKEVFVSLKAFSEDLGLARDTICRSVKRLVQKKLIRLTGKKVYGFYQVVEILPVPKEFEQPPKAPFNAPPAKKSTLVDRPIDAHCPTDRPQENKEINNKQQHVAAFEILKTLKSFNISPQEAKLLVERYPAERIERQIAHLELKLKNHDDVKSKAGWLIKAIRHDFQQSKVLAPQNLAQEEQIRNSIQLAKDADYLLGLGKSEESIKVAEKSLAMHENTTAKDVIKKAQAAITKKKQQDEALAAVAPEVFMQILAEEEAKQKTSLLRLGIKTFGEMAKQAAYYIALERVVAISDSSQQNLIPMPRD